MPVNKDALRRYRIIDRILSDPNHDYTTHEILSRVNRECPEDKKVELRMIQKDIKALEEEFGKKMIRNAGRRGTVKYEEQSEPLFYKELTSEEEEILREVLRSLGQFDGLDNFTWLDLLKRKLDMTEAPSVLPYISFSKNEGLQIPGTLLGRLFMAIARKTVIEIIYEPFGKSSHPIKVYPYQLKQYNDRWFLLCSPLDSSSPDLILNLALDRMKEDFKYVDDESYIECAVDLQARFDEIIGVTLRQENDVEEICFAVDDRSLDYIRTKWLHITQMEFDSETQEVFRSKYPYLKDKTFFSIECRENHELYARFASYMGNITIVEPIYIKEKMQSYFKEAANNYENI